MLDQCKLLLSSCGIGFDGDWLTFSLQLTCFGHIKLVPLKRKICSNHVWCYYEHFWSSHHKKKLITKIISNLVIYQASLAGRGPTKSDIEKVLKVLKISEASLGLLTKDNLLIAGKETIKGLHLSELFSTIDVDNL